MAGKCARYLDELRRVCGQPLALGESRCEDCWALDQDWAWKRRPQRVRTERLGFVEDPDDAWLRRLVRDDIKERQGAH